GFDLASDLRLAAEGALDGVHQLDLVAGARLGPVQLVEDLGQQDIAAEGRQVGWGVVCRRLLDYVDDLVNPALGPTRGDDSVAAHLALRHAPHREHSGARRSVGLGPLPHAHDLAVYRLVG